MDVSTKAVNSLLTSRDPKRVAAEAEVSVAAAVAEAVASVAAVAAEAVAFVAEAAVVVAEAAAAAVAADEETTKLYQRQGTLSQLA